MDSNLNIKISVNTRAFEAAIMDAQFAMLRVLWGPLRFFRPLWWALMFRKFSNIEVSRAHPEKGQ